MYRQIYRLLFRMPGTDPIILLKSKPSGAGDGWSSAAQLKPGCQHPVTVKKNICDHLILEIMFKFGWTQSRHLQWLRLVWQCQITTDVGQIRCSGLGRKPLCHWEENAYCDQRFKIMGYSFRWWKPWTDDSGAKLSVIRKKIKYQVGHFGDGGFLQLMNVQIRIPKTRTRM